MDEIKLEKLVSGLQRELKYRRYFWLVLAAVSFGVAYSFYYRIDEIIETVDSVDISESATPEMIRIATIHGMLPFLLNLNLIVLNLLASGYCIVEAFRSKREAHLLIHLSQKLGNQPGEGGNSE